MSQITTTPRLIRLMAIGFAVSWAGVLWAVPPVTPTNVQVAVVGADRVFVQWTDASADEAGFQIDIGTVASGTFSPHTLRTSVGGEIAGTNAARNTLTRTDLSGYLLAAGTQYQLRVRSYNNLGAGGTLQYSASSSVVTFTTPSPAVFNMPTGLQVLSAQATHVRLGWNDNCNIEDGYGYNFAIGGVGQPGLFGLTGVNGTSGDFEDIGSGTLQPGTNYTIQVWGHRTVDGNLVFTGGSTAVNPTVTFTTTTTQTFNPPTNFTGSVVGDAGFTMSWTDNSTTEDQFDIQFREGTSGTLSLVDVVPWNVTTSTIQGAVGKPNTTYQFQVRATKTGLSTVWVGAPLTINTTFSAPTNLVATAPVDETHVNLAWTDNSNAEGNYEVQYFDGNTNTWANYNYYSANVTSVTGIATGAPGIFRFRVRATYGVGPDIFSAFSNEAVINTLRAPTNLTGSSPSDGKFNVSWTDNSAQEGNYELQYRVKGTTTFNSYDFFPANTTSQTNLLIDPGAIYEFRVCATRGSQAELKSDFSNIFEISVPFNAPTNLAGSSPSEGKFNISWTDNSTVEANYEIQVRVTGSTSFTTYQFFPANTTSQTNLSIEPGFTYEFRVCATIGAQAQIKSAFTDIISINVPFNAPSGFAATPSSDRQVNLVWTDNSTIETAYVVYCKRATEAQFQICAVLPPGANSFQARAVDSDFNTPFVPNTAYDFQVFALFGNFETTHQNASATTKDGVTSDLSPPMFVGDVFNHTIQFSQGQGTVTSAVVTGTLPPGVNYNAGTFTLSGTPTTRGAFPCTLAVTWSNSWTQNYTLHLRPLHHPGPPVVSNPIANQTLTLGGTSTASLPLANVFSDLDSESAVRLDIPAADGTPSGRSITIILNNTVTPQTVANFMAYLGNAANGYTDTIFHRLVPGFILQGGAYKSSTAPAAPSNAFVSVPKLPAVANEPGISNVTGTLAMAKQAGNPNSATTDFFFNLANNASNLDAQNDGFTVFGRVTQSSLSLLTGTLNNLPLPPSSGNPNAPNYAVTVDGSNTVFTALPTNASGSSGPASIDSSKLLRVNGVDSSVELLARSVSGNSNATVVTAVINGSNLDLTGLAPGVSTVSLQATDLDGNQLVSPATFTVTVRDSFSNWAGGQGLTPGDQDPGDDPDFDNWTNLLEWALMTSPSAGNGSSALSPLLQPDGGGTKGAITFPVRKFATLTYIVEASGDLGSSSWSTVWTSTDGFAAAAVVAAVDHPDHTLVTIKDTAALGTGVQRFLRLRVTSP